MRRIRRYGSSPRSFDPPVGNLRDMLPLRFLPGASRRLLLPGPPSARHQLLPLPLVLSPLGEESTPAAEDLRRLADVQLPEPSHQILPFHSQSGDFPGPRRRGLRPHHRPRRHAGPSVAWALPHPRLPSSKAPIHPHHRVRVILRRPRLHRPETRRFRGLLVPPLRVSPDRRQNRKRDRSESTRDETRRGRGGSLDAAPAIRRHRERSRYAGGHTEAEAESGNDGGAGAELRRRRKLLSREVRGGVALLQRVVRRARRRIGGGEWREIHGGADCACDGDKEHSRGKEKGDDFEVERGAESGRI
ncbi:hypothetical protein Bca4012_083113 [Brassica carinata]